MPPNVMRKSSDAILRNRLISRCPPTRANNNIGEEGNEQNRELETNWKHGQRVAQKERDESGGGGADPQRFSADVEPATDREGSHAVESSESDH